MTMTIGHHPKHVVTVARTCNAIFMAIKLMEAYCAGNAWKEDSKMKLDCRRVSTKSDNLGLRFKKS
jgi:hypothetical protein